MTEDTSPENLRKFLESDDSALVRMGLSMAKGLDLKLTATDLVHFLKIAFPPIEDSRGNYVVGKETVKEILTDWLQEMEEIEKVEDEDTVVEALCNILWNTCPREDIPKVERHKATTGISAANVYIASAVVEILGEMGNEQAVEPLVKMLQYHEYYPTYGGFGSSFGPVDIRKKAAEALDMHEWKAETGELEAIYHIARGDWDACEKLGSSAVEPLIMSLGYDDPWDDGEEKSKALIAIGEPAVESLIEALEGRTWRDSATRHNDHVKVWNYIIKTLGKIDDERVVEPLIKLLSDKSIEKKWTGYDQKGFATGICSAVRGLGKTRSIRAVAPLIEMLASGSRVSDAAMKALEEIGEVARISLMDTVKKHGFGADVCERAKRVLERMDWHTAKEKAELGDGWTFESLIGFLEKDDGEVVNDAAIELAKLGDERSVKPLIEILRADLSTPSLSVNHGVAQALGKIGDARALDIFIQILRKCGGDERDIAEEALAKIGEPALDPLIDMLFGDDEYWIAKGAANALGKLGDEQSVEPLIEALELECERVQDWYCENEPQSSDGCWYRDGYTGFTCQESVDAIIQIGSKKAIEPLLGALANGLGGNWWLPGLAVEALTGLGWKPETDEQKASYLIATQDWDGCKKTGEPLVTEAVLYLAEPVRVYCGSGVFDDVMEAVNSFGETAIKIFKANECEEALETLGH
jgi:HEAT repeat protein